MNNINTLIVAALAAQSKLDDCIRLKPSPTCTAKDIDCSGYIKPVNGYQKK